MPADPDPAAGDADSDEDIDVGPELDAEQQRLQMELPAYLRCVRRSLHMTPSIVHVFCRPLRVTA